MHELCLHKIGPNKSDQAIGPELQNAKVKVKGRFRKKICEIFGVYHLLDIAKKYDQPIYFFLRVRTINFFLF